MTISFQTVLVRHEQRIRLVFSNTLTSGAFGSPAPSYYSVENIDGSGPDPAVASALIVPGSANVVELALSLPLAKSGLYRVSAIGVPAIDLSVTDSSSIVDIRWGAVASRENVEPKIKDRDVLLYGKDLIFNGSDFQENALGDLDTVSGTANVTKALNNGAEADGLPWDPNYGAHIREYIDSPSTAAGTMKGALTSQILRDPRVSSVKVTYEVKDDVTYLYADPKLFSGETATRVTVPVPSK